MNRLLACLSAPLFLVPAAALMLPFAAAGCGESSGDMPSIAPGTDDRSKEQKEIDDMMQNAVKSRGKAKSRAAR